MEKKDYIVAIDLGDSNIVVGVGSPGDMGRINIEHILSRPSEGVSAGQIVNIDAAIRSIKGALQQLKETTGIEVEEAYAGISGEFIYCSAHTDHVYVPDHKNGVTQQVVDALFERMENVVVSEDRYIMDRIPQRYVINDTTEVDDPVGVFGSPLSSTFNFISSDNIPLSRIDMALRRLNIIPRRTFSNAAVVGDAVLSADEKEEGVVVVDLGGELTDIAIYHRNILRYISTIPLGAKAFNNDIRTLTIPERYIEPLKLKYGCALAKNAPQELTVIIKGRTKHDQREVAAYNLAAVIEARARDIAELVSKEIADSGYADKVPYGIVLTGGSAQLHSIDELFREVTGAEVRVAEAEEVITPPTRTKIQSSADSTVVGLLLHGLKYGPCKVNVTEVAAPTHETSSVHASSQPVKPVIPVQTKPVVPQPRVVPQPQQQSQQQTQYTTPQAPTQGHAPRTINSAVVSKPEPAPQPEETLQSETPATPQQPTPAKTINELAQERLRREQVARAQEPQEMPEELDEELEDEPVDEPEEKQAAPAEEPKAKPKRRIFGILSNIARGANNLVNNVNKSFDVDEEV